MKILRVSPSFPSREFPGSGLNAYQHTLCSRHISEILIEDRNYEIFDIPSSEVHKIKSFRYNLGNNAAPFKKVLKLLIKSISIVIFTFKTIRNIGGRRYDIVHCYTPIYMLVGLYYKLFYNSKFVVSLHGTDFLTLKKLKLLWIIGSMPDRVYVVGQNMHVELKLLGYNNITYIGNGYDPQIFKHINSPREKVVVSVGGLRWQKGYDLLIYSFYKSKIYEIGYNLHIIGSGELAADLKLLTEKLGLVDKIKFLGSLSQPEISFHLNKSAFYVLSSISEGSPKAVLEALACGLPVLATNVGDIPNLIPTKVGYVVSTDSEALANGLKMMSNTSFNREFISEYVKNRTWTSIVKNIDQIYETI